MPGSLNTFTVYLTQPTTTMGHRRPSVHLFHWEVRVSPPYQKWDFEIVTNTWLDAMYIYNTCRGCFCNFLSYIFDKDENGISCQEQNNKQIQKEGDYNILTGQTLTDSVHTIRIIATLNVNLI